MEADERNHGKRYKKEKENVDYFSVIQNQRVYRQDADDQGTLIPAFQGTSDICRSKQDVPAERHLQVLSYNPQHS
jgi:hypothetical protein